MNRLSLALPPKSSASTTLRAARTVRKLAKREIPQCVLSPLHYEPNYAYPLVIWLHGAGSDEREIKKVMPLVSLRNYVSLSVRGTSALARGYDWPEAGDAILAGESLVADAVAQAKQRFNIHRERVFLAGADAGGTMALRLALRWPEHYAGGASIGGRFPIGHSPLARLAMARRSKLLMMHCRDSQSYSVEHVCQELSLFHAAGMSVTLRQYPCGDELTTQMLHDLDVWLMEQVTGVAASEQEPVQASEWN